LNIYAEFRLFRVDNDSGIGYNCSTIFMSTAELILAIEGLFAAHQARLAAVAAALRSRGSKHLTQKYQRDLSVNAN
jgi:hypothetical protein